MVLVEVFVRVLAYSGFCGIVVYGDRGVISWGVVCGKVVRG